MNFLSNVVGTQQPEIDTLIQACRNEELGAVKEIFARGDIDVNAVAKYRYDSNLLQGEFPLFAAAGNCNLELIKYLIAKGANVNSRTAPGEGKCGGMSPLQAAVSFRQDIDSFQRRAAVELLVSNGADPSASNTKGNPMWELCQEDQPDVTLLLLELGMNVTQKSLVTGITMLHRWAASIDPAAASIIELVLAKGADVKALNKQGISPLYAAAVGLTSKESSIKSLHQIPNDTVLRLLLQRDEYSLSEKIDALELAGAKLLHKTDDNSISKAFQYWNEALDLRDEGSIPKVPLKPNSIVHWRAVEWNTRDQLRELQNHPSVDTNKMQAILVAQRILSRISSGALLNYLWRAFTGDYCEALFDGNRNAELLDVCWTVLEGARLHDTREIFLWLMIEWITEKLMATLIKLQIDRNPILSSETLRLSLELFTETDVSHLENDLSVSLIRCGNHAEHMTVIYNLVSMISELPHMITPEIKCCLGQFVRRNGRDELGNNLLLIACNRKPNLSMLPVVRLLLDVGSDPNDVNEEGNSPLHLIAYWMGDESESPLADLLLQFGADLDQLNLIKETPLGVWKRKYAGPRDGPFPPPTWTMRTLPRLVQMNGKTVLGS